MRITNCKYKDWKKKNDYKKMLCKIKRKNKHKSNIKNKNKIDKIFNVPQKFSIIDNPEETVIFLNEIIDYVEKIRKLCKINKLNNYIRYVKLNMTNTNYITSDALMYLLSIIKNTRGKKLLPVIWYGNFPENKNVKEFLKKSGYLKYMETSSENIINTDNNIQIKNGFTYEYFDTDGIKKDIRSEIVDFTGKILHKEKTEINYLTTLLTEMVTNISDHAYDKVGLFEHNWYIFVDNKLDKITFTFMDNGLGIPTTIKKSIIEKIFEVIDAKNEYKYIEAAVNGIEKRSETGKIERGNGLPSIYEQYTSNNISNFVIISNKAYFRDAQNRDLKNSLNGTVFYWEIKKEVDL